MATFIESVPSLGTQGTKPSNAGNLIRTNQWGIDSTLSGYIIQDVSINGTRITDDTMDQKGALVSQLDYDERFEGTMTVIGGDGSEDGTIPGIETGMIDFEWAGHKWKVTGVQYTGNYQDKKRYQISFFRAHNFPPQQ